VGAPGYWYDATERSVHVVCEDGVPITIEVDEAE
jgi:hypothetical protein